MFNIRRRIIFDLILHELITTIRLVYSKYVIITHVVLRTIAFNCLPKPAEEYIYDEKYRELLLENGEEVYWNRSQKTDNDCSNIWTDGQARGITNLVLRGRWTKS